ncbi:hypothetical protein HN014_10545 [Aquimarina sp. TRL1]|uniref:hypothetical protein n=1 Tax=Aquimarina sp. (strain TRL1) TaxID=2736252 RepID=UPI001589822E|nr:hypothetical protein [Aquimarina sp. TRL1]QKX05335.1 hypothetical protein HN014_10545 [Aquimarina sp. TRL1]
MKDNPILYCIDKQFLKAIEKIRRIYSLNDLKRLSDAGIGKEIYGSNAHVVTQVREGVKHLPHLAMVNFARYFNIPMEYFYDESIELDFTIEQGDIHTSRIHKKEIEVLIAEKTQEFLEQNKANQNFQHTTVKKALLELQQDLAVELSSVTFIKIQNNAVQTINLALQAFKQSILALSSVVLKPTGQVSEFISNDKITLYKELLQSNQVALKAKDSENETLKKYIKSLEKQLDNNLLP